jgi:hypothetical protein
MTPTELTAIEAAQMSDEELADDLFATYMNSPGNSRDGFRFVLRRARELLAAPSLPPEPPPGFVRVRIAVTTGSDGAYEARGWHLADPAALDAFMLRDSEPGCLLSHGILDFPLPPAPAEIVGTVTP